MRFDRTFMLVLVVTLSTCAVACGRHEPVENSKPPSSKQADTPSAAAELQVSAAKPFVMKSADAYATDVPQPKIIGGTKADPAAWPATFIFVAADGSGCTSTIVGERVAITAAHCIVDGGAGTLISHDQQIAVVCQRHPVYEDVELTDDSKRVQASPDFALCVLHEPLLGGSYERIDIEGKDIDTKNKVHLLGFGCTEAGGSDGSFGVLYEGDPEIDAVPTPPTDYYTTTVGSTAVCSGDSGGGAYQFKNVAKTKRVLVGINSRGNLSTASLLSTTYLPGFLSWAREWASDKNVKICGIDAAATGCRPN